MIFCGFATRWPHASLNIFSSFDVHRFAYYPIWTFDRLLNTRNDAKPTLALTNPPLKRDELNRGIIFTIDEVHPSTNIYVL